MRHAAGDLSYGFYLERPSYLSLALVTCSPNRTGPGLPCPDGAAAGRDGDRGPSPPPSPSPSPSRTTAAAGDHTG